MSVLTCKATYLHAVGFLTTSTDWWGLEVVLPPPSLKYLDVCTVYSPIMPMAKLIKSQNAQSISHTVLNFMTAIAAVNNGVREILPFVRYISQFMEFEFNTIKSQNRGRGVVCAATWFVLRLFFDIKAHHSRQDNACCFGMPLSDISNGN
jgi:hypothetical protein